MKRYIITAARLNPVTHRFEKTTVTRETRVEARNAQWSMMRSGWKTNCRDTMASLTPAQIEAVQFTQAAEEWNRVVP